MQRDSRLLARLPHGSAACAGVIVAACAACAAAQSPATTLPPVVVKETPTVVEKNQLPATTEGVTREQTRETVNQMNVEDAIKYLPSLIVRKRNVGDQQAVLATRTSGLGQSARSLIYADGVLLSTLIGNNNSSASPRWSMVAPEEIARIDVLYGPFSAAYPGNSMGAVVEMTTRMPEKFEGSAFVQGGSQDYSLYGTSDTYRSWQAGALLGGRYNDFSWRITANHLDAKSQPLTIVTALQPAAPSGAGTPVTGAFADFNRLGQPIAVIGSGGIESKQLDNFKLKLAYDFTAEWRASYTIGLFQNDIDSRVDTYLRNAAGTPVYSGSVNIAGLNYNIPASAFSSNSGRYTSDQEHLAQSVSLKSNMQREWDVEAVASTFDYRADRIRFPGNALPMAESGGPGSIQSLDGTGWSTLDLKGRWRPQGARGPHQVTFGVHHDRYKLVNTTYATTDWIGGAPGPITANSLGKTQTNALWAQDAWRFASQYKLTLGGRYEWWRAYDGFNFSAVPASNVVQPEITSSKLSPKAALAWEASPNWLVTAAYGTAYRFPTVSELYQAVIVSGIVFTPNPNLRPERAYSGELAFERTLAKGRIRLSLFQEDLTDALIAQNSTIPGTNVIGSSIQNIDRVRTRGAELVANQRDVLVPGLELTGSMTYVDSRILSDPGFRNAAGELTDVTGKFTPNIPRFKATAVATYRYDDRWSGTLAARYSDRVWATLDNTDIYPHTFQGFESYFVADARVTYQVVKQWSAALGIDNLNNRKYYLFHPFPQRTVLAELRVSY